MNRIEWNRVKTILDDVLEAPPAARAEVLEKACAGNAAMQAEVETLLAAYEEGDRFFETPLVIGADGIFPERAGPYRIREVISRGGMSTVYLAERDDEQYRREVALKVIRPGLAGDFTHRFVAERQILASLNHPNIARLYDGGVMADGRPYLVMEYVEGQPIHRYCDERQLSVEERLALFITVAEAVQHAHRNLIVHRDLKPSNIFVRSDGTVKLLDFGIAKLLQEGLVPSQPNTQTGHRLMTPEYASPEQVRGGTITTASDVYQLGLLLYELLTGHQPFSLEEHKPYEVEQKILGTPPPKPSTIVRQSEDTQTRQLVKRLRGDLDAIVMKALRKEEDGRYASVEALVKDVRHHQSGRPVTARRGTWRYRAGTLMRRHRWKFATTAAFLVILLAYAATVTVQSRRIAEERDRAQQQAERAEQVSQFLVDLFEAADPERTQGQSVTARELVQRGGERIDDQLSDQPDVQAHMMGVLGNIHRRLGLYEEAETLLNRGVQLLTEAHGGSHIEVAEARSRLALFLRDQGRYEEAATHLEAALAHYRGSPQTYRSELADGLMKLTYVLRQQGDYQGAREAIEQALDIQRDLYGRRHLTVAEGYFNLAAILRDLGDLEEAERVQRMSLRMCRDLTDGPHPGVAANLNNLVILLKKQGELEEAEQVGREALSLNRALYGDPHVEVASSLTNVAGVQAERGAYAAADSLYHEALAMYQTLFGEEHPGIAVTLNNIGDVRLAQDNAGAAETNYRRAAAMQEALRGRQHPVVAANLVDLATALHAQERYDEAEPLLHEGCAVLKARHGLDDRRARNCLQRQATLYESWGRPVQAAAYRDSLAQGTG